MTQPNPFWRLDRPLVLASGSAARRQLLEAAAIPFEVVPATIDERAVESPAREAGKGGKEIAALLACAKACAVSRDHPSRLVLGGDQVLALGDRLFNKPVDRAAVRETLAALMGRTHHLHAGWALARGGTIVLSGVEAAAMTMRTLSPAFVEAYIEAEGDALFGSVGAYRLEGLGIQLFAAVEGDQATIMGLPLVPVLEALRAVGALRA